MHLILASRADPPLPLARLRALALEVYGYRRGALATLERALVFAAPEGYIRLFVDEGTPMLALLRQDTQPLVAYLRSPLFTTRITASLQLR